AGAAGDAAAAGPREATRARYLMGTMLRVTVNGPAEERTFEAAFDEVARLESVLSNWDDDSEVSRLNRAAAATPFRCSPDLYAALEDALRWAAATGGTFDPTVEPLVAALGLRDPEDRSPSVTTAVRTAGTPGPVGWDGVRLDRAGRTASFRTAGMGIDFGGIGKGIALDAAALRLRERGVRSALLDFGGQVLAIGAPAGRPGWETGVADPVQRDRPVLGIRLRDLSAATSGNSERGGRSGHLLDPRRGAPAPFGGTVTVVAADGTSADALSTALFVMGPADGMRFARDRGIAAAFLWRDCDSRLRTRTTSEFEVFLDGVRTRRHGPARIGREEGAGMVPPGR
ncbi:MAG: FAD:protein FMN transferase, partial [Candidatus Polarisedimenticolia bacterium]